MNFNRMDTAHRLRVDAKLFGGNTNIMNTIESVLDPVVVTRTSICSRFPTLHKQAYCLCISNANQNNN